MRKEYLVRSTSTRLKELEASKKALRSSIRAEKIKRELTKDEHSIKSYFDQYCHADLNNPEVRDMILEYFVDKIYLYENRLVITGNYLESEIEYDLKWEELKDSEIEMEFESFALGFTIKNQLLL